MTKPLWAPWRLEYVQQADETPGCVFCAEAAGELAEEDSLLVWRGEAALVVLNKFPYASGHLMVAPRRHVASPELLTRDERAALGEVVTASLDILRRAFNPAGFNLGANLGRVAGAGIADHLHWHAVPR